MNGNHTHRTRRIWLRRWWWLRFSKELRDLSGGRSNLYQWLLRSYVKNLLRALVAGTTLTVPAVLAIMTVAIPLYVNWLSTEHAFLSQLIALVFVLVAVTVVSGAIAVFSLYRLPPTDFAKVVVGGQQDSDIFRILSIEVWKICDRFKSFPSTRVLMKHLDNTNASNAAKSMEEHVDKLETFMNGQQNALQRIHQLKHLAATQMGIPPRRFCDRIIEFSPEMFANRVKKFVQNLREYNQQLLLDERPGKGARLEGIKTQATNIVDEIDKRLMYQAQLFQYHELHGKLSGFASGHSASAALIIYAGAISHVAQAARAPTTQRSFRLKTTDRNRFNRELIFLFYKQRAYPGFDLNSACISLCQQEKDETKRSRQPKEAAKHSRSTEHTGSSEDWENVQRTLGKLKKKAPRVWKALRDSSDSGDSSEHDDLLDENTPIGPQIEALANLESMVTGAIDRRRDEMMANFRRIYFAPTKKTPKPEGTKTFLVTHGFSKTVREVMKRLTDDSSRLNKPPPTIFLLRPDDEQTLDTRLMEYELKESMRKVTDVYVSEEGVLAKFVRDNTRIVVLLGGECFDRSKRVIHPKGAAKRVKKLKSEIELRVKGTEIVVFVIGEGYKAYDDLLHQRELFRAHLDRVSIFDSRFVDTIITDDSEGGMKIAGNSMADWLKKSLRSLKNKKGKDSQSRRARLQVDLAHIYTRQGEREMEARHLLEEAKSPDSDSDLAAAINEELEAIEARFACASTDGPTRGKEV